MNIYAAVHALAKIGESCKSLHIKIHLSLFGWIRQIKFADQCEWNKISKKVIDFWREIPSEEKRCGTAARGSGGEISRRPSERRTGLTTTYEPSATLHLIFGVTGRDLVRSKRLRIQNDRAFRSRVHQWQIYFNADCLGRISFLKRIRIVVHVTHGFVRLKRSFAEPLHAGSNHKRSLQQRD